MQIITENDLEHLSVSAVSSKVPNDPQLTQLFSGAPTRGTRLSGGFVIQECLGKGGMGVVWKAFDLSEKQSVALKLSLRTTFCREAAIAAFRKFQLVRDFRGKSGICVPERFEVDEEKSLFFLVMPFMEGETLQQRIQNAGVPFPKKEILPVLQSVAQSLDFIHSKNVIHCDVKPGNLFWVNKTSISDIAQDSSPDIRLFDWGNACSPGVLSEHIGTNGYMAPELWKEKPMVTPASDQFSLAVIAYELYSGRLPFSQNDDVPSEIPGLSMFANQALRKALSPRPEDRFASCLEFTEELARREKFVLPPVKELRDFLDRIRFMFQRTADKKSNRERKDYDEFRDWLKYEVQQFSPLDSREACAQRIDEVDKKLRDWTLQMVKKTNSFHYNLLLNEIEMANLEADPCGACLPLFFQFYSRIKEL